MYADETHAATGSPSVSMPTCLQYPCVASHVSSGVPRKVAAMPRTHASQCATTRHSRTSDSTVTVARGVANRTKRRFKSPHGVRRRRTSLMRRSARITRSDVTGDFEAVLMRVPLPARVTLLAVLPSMTGMMSKNDGKMEQMSSMNQPVRYRRAITCAVASREERTHV